MKKFLEELKKSTSIYNDVPVNTEAEKRYKILRNKYRKVIGCRALYIDKIEKESRVVTIKDVTASCIVAEYKCYGMEYQDTITMSISYASLFCGEAKLEVE